MPIKKADGLVEKTAAKGLGLRPGNAAEKARQGLAMNAKPPCRNIPDRVKAL